MTAAQKKAFDKVWGSMLGGIQSGARAQAGAARMPATSLAGARPGTRRAVTGRPGAATAPGRGGWRPVAPPSFVHRSQASRPARRGQSLPALSLATKKPSKSVQVTVTREIRRGETGRQATPPRELVRTSKGSAGGELRGANLVGVDFARDDLRGADLRRANLYRARMAGARLTGASLWAADLVEADLRGARLEGADMLSAGLVGADLSHAVLQKADLKEANLTRARLVGAVLQEANRTDANCSGADLRGASLKGANLRGADFTGTRLAGASLAGAFYSSATRWPAGFDPVRQGALRVD
jgi:hypothetical protein